MEKRIKELEETVKNLQYSLSEITLQYYKLEERMKLFEESSGGTGIYLDGAPDYVVSYLEREEPKKDGVINEK